MCSWWGVRARGGGIGVAFVGLNSFAAAALVDVVNLVFGRLMRLTSLLSMIYLRMSSFNFRGSKLYIHINQYHKRINYYEGLKNETNISHMYEPLTSSEGFHLA